MLKPPWYAKGLDTWTHLLALLFAQLSGCNSLRDNVNGLRSMPGHLSHLGISHPPSRNALSHQNATRDWRVFRELYLALHKYPGQHLHCSGELRLPRGESVLLPDSGAVTLCLNLFPWTKYRREKGAIKLHTLFATKTLLPMDIHVSDGTKADNMGAYRVFPDKRSVIVADRGYNDSELWNDWDSNGVTFVVRFKSGTGYKRVKEPEQPDDTEQDILIDELIVLNGEETKTKYPHVLRHIAVYRPQDEAGRSRRRRGVQEEQDKEDQGTDSQVIEIVTNNMTWSAGTIAALYRLRREIETFFKLIKQHLKINSFLGTSKNAVMCQIWTAMIAMLILRYLKARSAANWTMAALVVFLRISLLRMTDLMDRLNRRFDVEEKPPDFELTNA